MEELHPMSLMTLIEDSIDEAVGRELIGYPVLKDPATSKMLEGELQTVLGQRGLSVQKGSSLELEEVPISAQSLIGGQIKLYFTLSGSNFRQGNKNTDFNCRVNVTPSGASARAVSLSDWKFSETESIE